MPRARSSARSVTSRAGCSWRTDASNAAWATPSAAATCAAVVGLTWPERLAEGAAIGRPAARNSACATGCAGTRSAIVSVLGSVYPVATVLLAHVVLGERITWVQRAGVVCALTGVAFVSAG